MRKRSFKDNQSSFFLDYAGLLSIVFFAFAFLDLFLTLYFPMSSKTDPGEIYSRNFTTILASCMLAFFFDFYRRIHLQRSNTEYRKLYMKQYIVTISLAVACLIKVIASAIYAVQYLSKSNMAGLFHLAEILVWLAVAAFALMYLTRLHKPGH